MARKQQYNQQFIDLLEMGCGEGLFSVGGTAFIDSMFKGYDLDNKKILDIGCGTGGVAFHLAEKNKCKIISFDVEPLVIKIAKKRQKNQKLQGEISFICGDDVKDVKQCNFDLVFARGSSLHIKNKQPVFKKVYEFLNPGGVFIIEDWFRPEGGYSALMKKFMKSDGVTMFLITPDDCKKMLEKAGFQGITHKDLTKEERKEVAKLARRIETDLSDKIQSEYGYDYWHDYCIPSINLQEQMLRTRQLLAGRVTACK